MAEAPIHPSLQDPLDVCRLDWIARVGQLVNQIDGWSLAENWATERHEKSITERLLGTYVVPELIVRLGGGELMVNPIALHIAGGNGRVDLEAIPTLSRVKLIGVPGGWQIWTDSNVPLRIDWNRENFTRLTHDLLS